MLEEVSVVKSMLDVGELTFCSKRVKAAEARSDSLEKAGTSAAEAAAAAEAQVASFKTNMRLLKVWIISWRGAMPMIDYRRVRRPVAIRMRPYELNSSTKSSCWRVRWLSCSLILIVVTQAARRSYNGKK